MKSLQDYIDKYREVASNLNLTGDSVELLIQLLANSTYISEIEHINYSNESSLERATLLNSKIQQCMNIMYSVFRGTCPRVIVRFRSKKYFELNLFDEISTSNNFKLYYIGYHKDNNNEFVDSDNVILTDVEGTQSIKKDGEQYDDFIYAPTIIPPTGDNAEYRIICILANKLIKDTQTLPDTNRYYIDINQDDLSNDLWVRVNGQLYDVYRKFSDHIKNGGLFDLTLPSFGLRLYAPDIFRQEDSKETDILDSEEQLPPANTSIETNVFKYCKLSDFTDSELSKIKIKGAELDKEFVYKTDPNTGNLTDERKYPDETYPGLTLIESSDKDTVDMIHYKANRDRYSNSIIRSNYDVGTMLEEYFPDKVVKGGTYYKFEKANPEETDPDKVLYKPKVTIYYIPYSAIRLISQAEIEEFKKTRSSYYVTDDIVITTGNKKNIFFTISVQLYKNERIDSEVADILKEYENKFDMDLDAALPEIESAISKISNVRSILNTKEEKIIDGKKVIILNPGVSYKELLPDGTYGEDYAPSKDSYCSISYIVDSILYTRK